ncbi:gluconate 2-dehydrogenase subunit 3 family protein [Shewanella mesophila]|uniref:gluconate 2-dehydrogenase subunit 3 family protein n=1 Tax=Shewanella mesophila TaxID=2864208 RepID=UPI001C6612B7|nr:gluconate 2-dehydrogenase subunit 3 family protein [Shewanella mesophila]QYJ87003.1 gluconate 2-dehydrogenase subunit 3 family protein [Shewanella mesophila]
MARIRAAVTKVERFPHSDQKQVGEQVVDGSPNTTKGHECLSSVSAPLQPLFAYASGLSRRDFLKRTGAATILLSVLGAKPSLLAAKETEPFSIHSKPDNFDVITHAIVETVQMHLFPDDGDGPSAKDLNADRYLLWALDDPGNIEDGDRDFIIQGAAWLEDLADTELKQSFLVLDWSAQAALLTRIANSRAGENWLSLLLYYLLEALTLDPIYGGNPDGVGWQWLEHQSGFPRPMVGKTYLDF